MSDAAAREIVETVRSSGLTFEHVAQARDLLSDESKLRERTEQAANAAQEQLTELRKVWRQAFKAGDQEDARRLAQQESAASRRSLGMTEEWTQATNNYVAVGWLVHTLEAEWFVHEAHAWIRQGRFELSTDSANRVGYHFDRLVASLPETGLVSRVTLSRIFCRLREDSDIQRVQAHLDSETLEVLRSASQQLHGSLAQRFSELYPPKAIQSPSAPAQPKESPTPEAPGSAMRRLEARLDARAAEKKQALSSAEQRSTVSRKTKEPTGIADPHSSSARVSQGVRPRSRLLLIEERLQALLEVVGRNGPSLEEEDAFWQRLEDLERAVLRRDMRTRKE